MHAEVCPVCKGEGNYNGKQCHGCNGKGWVEVTGHREYSPAFPIITYPYNISVSPYYPSYTITIGDYCSGN